MDRKYIDDHHIVARYLADQLAESEREAFEAYYLEHPEIVQEMEAVAYFKAGLQQLDESGDLDSLIHRKPRPSKLSWIAAAAAIGAVAVGVAWFVNHESTPERLVAVSLSELSRGSGTSLTISSTQRVMRRRGAVTSDADIALPDPPGAIELQVLPEYEDSSGRYQARLFRTEGDGREHVATIDSATQNQDGLVVLYVHSARLPPGLYELELAAASPPASAQSSIFSIRLHDGRGETR